jgi:hypothetical protein
MYLSLTILYATSLAEPGKLRKLNRNLGEIIVMSAIIISSI